MASPAWQRGGIVYIEMHRQGGRGDETVAEEEPKQTLKLHQGENGRGASVIIGSDVVFCRMPERGNLKHRQERRRRSSLFAGWLGKAGRSHGDARSDARPSFLMLLGP